MRIVIAVHSSFGKIGIDEAYSFAMVIQNELKDTNGVQEIRVEVSETGYRQDSWVIGDQRTYR